MKIIICCFFALGIQGVSFNVYAGVEKIAVVIGSNEGLANENTLRYAESDAKRVCQVLLELGDVTSARNYLLLRPKTQDICLKLTEISGRIKEIQENGNQVVLFLYYSGHGGQDALHVNGEIFLLSDLLEFLSRAKADLKIVVVDACYSGAILSQKGGKIAPSIDIAIKDELQVKGTIILTSSSADQISNESSDLQSSVFTHYFISGLRGAADYNRDNVISLGEILTYAKAQTSQEISAHLGASQRPAYEMDISGSEEVYLTRLLQGNARLKLYKGTSVSYYVISETYQKVVSEFTSQTDTVMLALPKDRYIIQKLTQKEISRTRVDLTWGGEKTIDLSEMKPYPRLLMRQKGPFNWVYDPNRVDFKILTYRDYPAGVTWEWLPGLSYNYEFGEWALNLQFSGGTNTIKGTRVILDKQIYMLTIGASKYLILHPFLSAYISADAGTQWLVQKSIRYDEARLNKVGYPALPIKHTWAPLLNIRVGISKRLWNVFSVDFSPGVTDFIPLTETGRKHYLRPNFAGSMGVNF